MAEIRLVRPEDRAYWTARDPHLSAEEFEKKARDRQAYLLLIDGEPAGLLRFSLFWDSIPFCNLLWLEKGKRRRGFGRMLMERWEEDMRRAGYRLAMVSTQADEEAQHFYRRLGYRDCGCLILDEAGFAQPAELLMRKTLL